ncbi:ABC transporter ATP-binding protein [Haemophilus influenzae]|uniref:ABC transporter ATP-binding protein n=1 Tax=Haemophilus influenzae TaxID=727 RepID=UPI003DA186D9
MNELSLDVDKLLFGYDKPLYLPLTFQCKKGEVISVLGTNGKGKTTLLHLLAHVLPVMTGQIRQQGHIGFVPQSFSSPDYSVLEIVLMGRASKIGAFNLPSKADETVALQMLARLDILHLAERNINMLSGGQRQLVLIARALATECQILILDEPTAALDVYNQQRVLQLIRFLATEQKMTIIFSTHDPYHSLCVADNVLLLLPNQQWKYGIASQILTESHLKQAYNVPIKYSMIEEQQVLVPIFTIQ